MERCASRTDSLLERPGGGALPQLRLRSRYRPSAQARVLLERAAREVAPLMVRHKLFCLLLGEMEPELPDATVSCAGAAGAMRLDGTGAPHSSAHVSPARALLSSPRDSTLKPGLPSTSQSHAAACWGEEGLTGSATLPHTSHWAAHAGLP